VVDNVTHLDYTTPPRLLMNSLPLSSNGSILAITRSFSLAQRIHDAYHDNVVFQIRQIDQDVLASPRMFQCDVSGCSTRKVYARFDQLMRHEYKAHRPPMPELHRPPRLRRSSADAQPFDRVVEPTRYGSRSDSRYHVHEEPLSHRPRNHAYYTEQPPPIPYAVPSDYPIFHPRRNRRAREPIYEYEEDSGDSWEIRRPEDE
jgi:hypothetical protein